MARVVYVYVYGYAFGSALSIEKLLIWLFTLKMNVLHIIFSIVQMDSSTKWPFDYLTVQTLAYIWNNIFLF